MSVAVPVLMEQPFPGRGEKVNIGQRESSGFSGFWIGF
jgi:hypothetical protein